MQLRFFMTLQLRYILAHSNYLLRLRYKMVIFHWSLVHRSFSLFIPHNFQFFLNFIFSKFTHSFDKTNARFCNEILHLFGFP